MLVKKLGLLLLLVQVEFTQAHILDDLSEMGTYIYESLYDYGIYQANQLARLVSKPAGQYQVLGFTIVVIAACVVCRRQFLVHKIKSVEKAQKELSPEELAAAGHGRDL